jgi:hypothetical protein
MWGDKRNDFGLVSARCVHLIRDLCPLHSLQIETAHIEGQLQGIGQSFNPTTLIGIVAQSISDLIEISEFCAIILWGITCLYYESIFFCQICT